MSYHALSQACPPCSIAAGGQCLPCPEGSDIAECDGCVGGQMQATFWERSQFMAPVVIGVATAIATGLAVAWFSRKTGKQIV